jgi:hypothetical protein
MSTRAKAPEPVGPPYVSTGHLPPPEQVRHLVAAAYERYKSNADGQNPQFYPADANWFDKHGAPTVTIGAGQYEIHTVNDYVGQPEFANGCRPAVALATPEV